DVHTGPDAADHSSPRIRYATLTEFRSSWKGTSGLSATKKLERLRAFFNFCKDNRYVDSNPAKGIKNPKIKDSVTLPFTHDQMMKILTTAEKRIAEAPTPDRRTYARRIRMLALFLRYSGLRISDAVGCACDRLQKGKLFLHTAKTGEHVNVPLPPFVIEELERMPKKSATYWFWNGTSSLETARKDLTDGLKELLRAAGKAQDNQPADSVLENGHAHMFRDTFAVEHLLAATPIEDVAKFLGHSSTKITEKHYNPWVRARQERAEAH